MKHETIDRSKYLFFSIKGNENWLENLEDRKGGEKVGSGFENLSKLSLIEVQLRKWNLFNRATPFNCIHYYIHIHIRVNFRCLSKKRIKIWILRWNVGNVEMKSRKSMRFYKREKNSAKTNSRIRFQFTFQKRYSAFSIHDNFISHVVSIYREEENRDRARR